MTGSETTETDISECNFSVDLNNEDNKIDLGDGDIIDLTSITTIINNNIKPKEDIEETSFTTLDSPDIDSDLTDDDFEEIEIKSN